MIFLLNALEGNSYNIVEVEQGRSVKLKLNSMGLYPGVVVKVIKNDRSGPLIVEVNSSRVILGRCLAEKISVNQI